MKIKLMICRIFFFILLITILGCEDMILEYDSITDLKVRELAENNVEYLEISGLCMHSSMNIKKVNSYKNNDTLYIEVVLTIKREKSISGNLKEKILLDRSINKVVFGKKRKLIWHRNNFE